MKVFTIRNERPGDWEAVETLTRRAFYNQYIPGCMEHYLVHICLLYTSPSPRDCS